MHPLIRLRSPARWLVAAALLFASGAAHASQRADRIYEPDEPGAGAKLLAVDGDGDLLYLRPDAGSKKIVAIGADHGKLEATYEGLAPATCACVEEDDWLLAGDAEGRVLRWHLRDGERAQLMQLKDDDDHPRAVKTIVRGRNTVFVLSNGLLVELSRAVFSDRFDAQRHARVVFRKDGYEIECISERKGIIVTSDDVGTLHAFKPPKADEYWSFKLGYKPTTLLDVEKEGYFFEAKETLRLIKAKRGEIYEERGCPGATCAVLRNEGETIYVGLRSKHVVRYVADNENDAHGLSPEERERQRHDHNTFFLREARRWRGFEGAVSAMALGPRGRKLFVSDDRGYLYEIHVDDEEDDSQMGR